MLHRVLLLALVLLASASVTACGASGGNTADGAGADIVAAAGEEDDAAAIEVPDVSGEDGADAVSTVEDAGLQATLADTNDDPGFDSTRDPTGCDVVDQDPAAGDEAADGDEVTITVDCSQVDWENQEGAQWEAFDDAYTAAFDDGCQALFDQSPDGSLYEDDTEYTVDDCQGENPGDASEASDVPADVPDDPESAGQDLGELDGCQALFENQGAWTLSYGTDSYTEDDCPIGSAAPAPAASSDMSDGTPAKPTPSSHSAGRAYAGDACTGTQSDGTPIVLTVTTGKIKCAGAVALLNEWLARAPAEGQGSGGYMELYGWECVGASAAEPTRIGTCARRSAHEATFTASVAPGE